MSEFRKMNIHGLPVYRDALGGVGTPTSDHEHHEDDAGHPPPCGAHRGGYDGWAASGCRTMRNTSGNCQRRYCQSDGGTYVLYE